MADVIAFGEVLWDIIDGVPHLGGAPLNFAAHVRQCGMSSAIVSAVGKDRLGELTLGKISELGVETTSIFTDPRHPTGTVDVTLNRGVPSYQIHDQVAWDFIAFPLGSGLPMPPRAFYFGTLAQRSPVSRATLERLLALYRSSEIFFDVNLRQTFWNGAQIKVGLEAATLLKINEEEAGRLAPILTERELGIEELSLFLFSRFPRLKVILITLGEWGCQVAVRGKSPFILPAVKTRVVNPVGAGDAFSAAFIVAWLKGATARQAAEAGNIRGSRVVSIQGAIPDDDIPSLF